MYQTFNGIYGPLELLQIRLQLIGKVVVVDWAMENGGIQKTRAEIIKLEKKFPNSHKKVTMNCPVITLKEESHPENIVTCELPHKKLVAMSIPNQKPFYIDYMAWQLSRMVKVDPKLLFGEENGPLPPATPGMYVFPWTTKPTK